MIPNVVEGANMTGLVSYLAGPGRQNDHTNQHVIAGSRYVEMEFAGVALGRADVVSLARHIDAPRREHDVDCRRSVKHVDTDTGKVSYRKVDAGVFHVSLSLSADEGELTDEKWAAIAHDYIDRMGFGAIDDAPSVRWAAIRHGLSKNGNDHIHLAVSIVRTNGAKVDLGYSHRRSQIVAGELEREHGLRVLETRDMGVGSRGVKPAEQARTVRDGLPETERERLERVVRAAAAASRNDLTFVDAVRASGVMIRPYYAKGSRTEVAGYSVAARPRAGSDPVWFGGGRLSRELTLPRLRNGWGPTSPTVQEAAWRSTRDGTSRVSSPGAASTKSWEAAASQLKAAAERLKSTPATDRAAWTSAAREVAGVYSAWSYRVEGAKPGPLREVSRQLGKIAATPARDAKRSPSTSPRLIAAETGMLLMVASGQASSDMAYLMVARQLTAMTRSIIDWKNQAGLTHEAERTERALTATLAAVQPAGAPAAPPAPKTAEERARDRLREIREAQNRTAGHGAPGSDGSVPYTRRRPGPGQGPTLGR